MDPSPPPSVPASAYIGIAWIDPENKTVEFMTDAEARDYVRQALRDQIITPFSGMISFESQAHHAEIKSQAAARERAAQAAVKPPTAGGCVVNLSPASSSSGSDSDSSNP